MDPIAQFMVPDVKEIQRLVQEAIKGLLPGQVPAFAKGVVKASVKGWCRVEYYDALTGSPFSFYEAPTVVAVALTREGPSRLVTAPVISIPDVKLPSVPEITVPKITLIKVPTISVPSIKLPEPAEITIPKPQIPYLNENFPAFYAAPGIGHDVVQALCDTLNKQRSMLYKIQGQAYDTDTGPVTAGINGAIYWANKGLKAAYETVERILKEIIEFRDNAQAALNSFSGTIKEGVDKGLTDLADNTRLAIVAFRRNVEGSVNAVMKDYRDKTQEAFNIYRDTIQSSVNAGLSQFIPTFYDMMGLPPPAVSPEEQRKLLREMGDVNGDGKIDVLDVGLIQRAIGMSPRDPRFGLYDLNRDGVIDESDVAIVSKNFGKTVVPPRVQLFSPAQLRNVTKDGFEFYGLSAGMQLSYVAIGRR